MDTVASFVAMTTGQGQHSGGVSVCVRTASTVARVKRRVTFTDATHKVCSLHESKNKSTRPTHEILLSVWSVLMLIVNIYFDIFGRYGGYTVKSLDIFGVEKRCVYRIIVTLSCSLEISWIFWKNYITSLLI